MSERSLTEYPHPQQWFHINMAGVTWRELWVGSGNPVIFLFAMPFVAPLKLLHVRLPAGQLPREITFQTPRAPVPEPQASRAQGLLDELAKLGFRHFSTFIIPEVQHAPMKYYCVHDSQQAYANVTYWSAGEAGAMASFSGKGFVFPEFWTHFADGSHLMDIGRKAHPSIDFPPEKTVRYHRPTSMPELWERHGRLVQEMAPRRGGLSPYMNAEELFTFIRSDTRRFADYQYSRGVAYPSVWQGPPRFSP